jgi:DNA-binding response OmpR family regulator
MSVTDDKSPDLTGMRVLVVEDEELIAMLVEDFLTEIGCSVVGPAATVTAALPLADSEPISGALLDLNLNGDLVYPVADNLAARGIPFIFTTGYASEEIVARHADAPTLKKPFSSRLLREAIVAHFANGWTPRVTPL